MQRLLPGIDASEGLKYNLSKSKIALQIYTKLGRQ
jgi:hypothetical protein